MTRSRKSSGERFLVFELNWLGDMLFSLPFLKALRAGFPDAVINCVVVPRYRELFAGLEWMDDILVLSDENGLLSVAEKMAFTARVAQEGYDTAIFLKSSRSKALMSRLAGIPRRVGFSGKRAALTDILPDAPADAHRADRILHLLKAFDVDMGDGFYDYSVPERYLVEADEILEREAPGPGRKVVLNPGGNWAAKRWPLEHFKDLGRALLAEFEDIEIIVTGSEKDSTLAGDLVRGLGAGRARSLAGRTSVALLAAVFRKSSLVVSADSGPLHLASSVGAVTVGLFGPTSPEVTGPRGRGRNIVIFPGQGARCRVPCYEAVCPRGHECMLKITPDMVLDACREELARGGRP